MNVRVTRRGRAAEHNETSQFRLLDDFEGLEREERLAKKREKLENILVRLD